MAIWGYGDVWGYKGNVVGSFLKYRLGYYRTSSWKAIGKSQIIPSNIGRYCSPQTNHQPSEAFETVNVRWGWDRCMSVFLCILGPFVVPSWTASSKTWLRTGSTCLFVAIPID